MRFLVGTRVGGVGGGPVGATFGLLIITARTEVVTSIFLADGAGVGCFVWTKFAAPAKVGEVSVG